MEYSPSEFYTHATDKKGHCVSTRHAMSPEMHSTIAALIASRKIPAYKTDQDFHRDADRHRLEWINENIDGVDLTDALSTISAIEALEREVAWYKLGEKMISEINFIRTHARTSSDWQRFKRYVDEALQADIPETARLELLRIGDRDIL